MVEIVKQLISAQKEIKIVNNEFIVRKRAFPTPEGNHLSSWRPRKAAGQSSRNNNVKVPVTGGITLSTLENMFDNLKQEVALLNRDSAQRYDPYNLNALRSNTGRVMVKWTKEDETKGWKPEWYTAIIKQYVKELDMIEVEYISEPGRVYRVKVEECVQKGTMRLYISTCKEPDLYDQISEIGASLKIKWSNDKVKESGWKAGWYHVEVQEFHPDRDEITLIYKKEPTVIYTECVT